MIIILTRAQWKSIVPLLKQGLGAEQSLGVPVEIENGDQKIEIAADEVKITLVD